MTWSTAVLFSRRHQIQFLNESPLVLRGTTTSQRNSCRNELCQFGRKKTNKQKTRKRQLLQRGMPPWKLPLQNNKDNELTSIITHLKGRSLFHFNVEDFCFSLEGMLWHRWLKSLTWVNHPPNILLHTI